MRPDTPRGQWIGDHERILLHSLLRPEASASQLDVGCGTGRSIRRFARLRLSVSGFDPDPATLKFAKTQGDDIRK